MKTTRLVPITSRDLLGYGFADLRRLPERDSRGKFKSADKGDRTRTRSRTR
jgi:hypothetical protein